MHENGSLLFEKEELIFNIGGHHALAADLASLAIAIPGADTSSAPFRQLGQVLEDVSPQWGVVHGCGKASVK
jgi:hypothetical protein